ncbi:hypothetical protein COLO4_10266 [Corchorus olitorius]|uniref:Uncharacterized protein n=1 Tax=Corchorus olitorius TaxID=93759 RepID=A0A1R3K9F2_9ROSI|nr:hypothetical protein COLO4_10266 [Corchorus olitorius]
METRLGRRRRQFSVKEATNLEELSKGNNYVPK